MVQLYFEKIIQLTLNRFETSIFKQALLSLTTDFGLHPLVPYFAYFVSDEVAKNLNNLPFLIALMRLVWSLVHNPNLLIEPYLHQLMPSVITCIIAKLLGDRSSDNHWKLRNLAANIVASICKRYGHVYHNLQPRVTRTLLHAFLDPTKSLPQQFGAIQGLAALGPRVVQLLVLPNVEPYLRLVEPDFHLQKQKNEMKRHEARRVYTALLCAAGECINHHLKMLPTRLAAKKTVAKAPISTIMQNKRKASMDNMMMMMQQQQQPPLKRLASEGSMHSTGMQAGYSPNVGVPDVGFSSMSRPLPNENVPGGSSGRRDKVIAGSGQPQKISTLDTGSIISSITQYFGESLLSFVPSHELSMFL
jgi:transcription initiation factor TFIID subunit 6